MHEFAINALILAEAGRKRDGLFALLSAVHGDLMVLTAENPIRALEVCRQRKVSLILIDATILPKGLKEFIAALRRIHPEIIRLVIVRSLREHEGALKAGANATLTTGYTSESFFKVVKTLIRNRSVAPQPACPLEPQAGISADAALKLKDLLEFAAAAPCSERGQPMTLLPMQNDETLPRLAEPSLLPQDLSGYYAERLQAIAELLLQLSRSTQTLKLKLAGLKQAEEQFARLIEIYQENHIDTEEIEAVLDRLKQISAGHLQEGCPDNRANPEEKRVTYPSRPVSHN